MFETSQSQRSCVYFQRKHPVNSASCSEHQACGSVGAACHGIPNGTPPAARGRLCPPHPPTLQEAGGSFAQTPQWFTPLKSGSPSRNLS